MIVRFKRFLSRHVPGCVIAHRSRFTGTFIGSPAICRLSATHFVVSHDLFGPKSHEFVSPETHVWHTHDAGITWKRISVISGAFWSRLFTHNGALYLFGTNRHHGDIVIRRSFDNGITWTTPLSETTGLLRKGMFHMAPTAVVTLDGRLYFGIEFANGVVPEWAKRYGASMASVPAEADLLDARTWNFSNVLYYNATYLQGCFEGWLESNVVIGPAGGLFSLLRVEDPSSFHEKAAVLSFDAHTNTLSCNPDTDFVSFPGGSKKFSVLFDSETGFYVALVNSISEIPQNIYLTAPSQIRNSVALLVSTDLRTWELKQVVLKTNNSDWTAFQYISFAFDGEDIIFVSRTAAHDWTGGAHSYHDANFLTFHRVPQFRRYLQ